MVAKGYYDKTIQSLREQTQFNISENRMYTVTGNIFYSILSERN